MTSPKTPYQQATRGVPFYLHEGLTIEEAAAMRFTHEYRAHAEGLWRCVGKNRDGSRYVSVEMTEEHAKRFASGYPDMEAEPYPRPVLSDLICECPVMDQQHLRTNSCPDANPP